ncbi:class I SAM-dependent methyltransferase [Pseudohalocynthiibacter aestuariivivens]|uniref:Class I SAM-dependent methyltransferase n=1 Tax=Pseudohalocynthiibacter aestuariivivens TaxID=1591409 RepID=A0ABV5JDG1_9RHOB|nr:class I SAM-dependent methyltransferase [Pseudohalocynthiibacter aestuariivivens]MBS9718537.1 class I SAM-dependent methyltransferase [Pseudohalocynthiibacter aestuariivivens]
MSFDADAYKKAVTEEWGRAAKGWHAWIPEINEWLKNATERMLDAAHVEHRHKVIDIAAGDGGQSIAAAERVGLHGEVLATDIVPEFVEIATFVTTKMGLKQLKAAVMDAEELSVPDKHYDAAISRLGLMYLPNLQRALAEIGRVLKPGGRVSAVVFTTADKTPFFSIPVRLIRERRGLSAPIAGQPGPFSLGMPGILADQFERAGFSEIEEEVFDAPLRFRSAEECVRWRREASGTMQQMLSGMDDTAKAAIWSEIIEALKQFEDESGFESPCELLLCSATK